MPAAPIETIVDPARRAEAGAIVQDGYDMDTHWHSHDMHQLQYAFEGSIEVEDARARHRLPSQLAAWIPAGVAHRTSLHRVRSGSVLLTPAMTRDAGDRVRIIEVSPLMREMVMGAMRWPLGRPLDEVGRAYFGLFALLCGEWIDKEAPLSLPTTADPALLAAMEHTRENLVSGDMASAARAAGMSGRSLRRRFEAEVGMNWREYRQRARLLAAVELLSNGRSPIGVVAAEVGFESQSTFAKAFRALLGRSPSAFRRGG
jgi:AraC-like DNA-binding protein